MKVTDSSQPKEMQQLMDTEEDSLLELLPEETNNGLTKANSEEMIQHLNQ